MQSFIAGKPVTNSGNDDCVALTDSVNHPSMHNTKTRHLNLRQLVITQAVFVVLNAKLSAVKQKTK